MPKNMRDLGEAIYLAVAGKEAPDPALGADKRRAYDNTKLAGLDGGSANLGWLHWIVGLFGGGAGAREYFVARIRHELQAGLGGGEQFAWTYGDLHLGCVSLAWWWAWTRGDEELAGLAGAWVERWLLVQCLCGRRIKGSVEFLAPGMRKDKGGDRSTEEAIAAHLLGIPTKFRDATETRSGWTSGWILAAVRAASGIAGVTLRVRGTCLRALEGKGSFPERMYQVALHIPMEIYGNPLVVAGSWLAVMRCGWCHPQDPPALAGGVSAGFPVVLYPWLDGIDPGEGGWTVETVDEWIPADLSTKVVGVWRRHGDSTLVISSLKHHLRLVLTLHQPTIDPLSDLPPLPAGVPKVNAPAAKPPRKPKPAPEPPKAEPAGGDLRADALALRKHVKSPKWTAVVDRLMDAAGVGS